MKNCWKRYRGVCHEKIVLSDGFTVPELLVVMVLTLLFTSLIIQYGFGVWGQVGVLQNSSDTLLTRQNLGDSLRNRLNEASSLLNQNSIADAHTMVADPTNASGSFWELIHAVPATITMPPAGSYSPIIYYAAPAVDSSKDFIMNGTQPYQNEYILYLDGDTQQLMLRTLAYPVSGNTAVTTCPPSAASSSCPSDRILADDVSYVSTKYYSRSGNELNWQSVIDPNTGLYIGPDYSQVEVVELTVGLQKRAVIKGTPVSKSETTIRVALRNG